MGERSAAPAVKRALRDMGMLKIDPRSVSEKIFTYVTEQLEAENSALVREALEFGKGQFGETGRVDRINDRVEALVDEMFHVGEFKPQKGLIVALVLREIVLEHVLG